jgi:molybdenum cofactor sulfurtransferase
MCTLVTCVGVSWQVLKVCALERVQLRGGCVCNVGACHAFLGLSSDDVKRHVAAGHVCWDDNDVIAGPDGGPGVPTGAVRASFGYMSSAGTLPGVRGGRGV